MPILPKHLYMQYLKIDGTGSRDMNVNHAALTSFRSPVSLTEKWEFSRLNFVMSATGIKYGQFLSLATLGDEILRIRIRDANDAVLKELDGGVGIKVTEDFGALAGVDSIAEPAAGPDSLPVRFSAFKATEGHNIWILPGNYIEVAIGIVDFSSFATMRVMAQGMWQGPHGF